MTGQARVEWGPVSNNHRGEYWWATSGRGQEGGLDNAAATLGKQLSLEMGKREALYPLELGAGSCRE